jgi:endoglucanase
MENSYVTGWGTETTNYPHHRYWCPQMKAGWPYAPSGCLSGGPNSAMNDPMIQGAGYKIGELAPQKCYYDQNDAWSVNEITINWNSPVVWISSFLEDNYKGDGKTPEVKPDDPQTETPTAEQGESGDPSKVLWGDADLSDAVDIMDVIRVNKVLVGAAKLEGQGLLNADVNVSGDIDSSDSLNVLKLALGVLKQSDMPVKKS